jgi:hypothetical protein
MQERFHPPAFCPKHGIFPAAGIAIAPGATRNSFIGCTHSCPKCGHPAEIIPGVYDATQTNLNILVDASISPSALAGLREIVGRLKEGKISVGEARAEAEKISPSVGRLFDIEDWSDQAKATLYAAIIGAVAIAYAAKTTTAPSVTVNVQPTVERIVEVDRGGGRSSSRPVPLPRPRPKR